MQPLVPGTSQSTTSLQAFELDEEIVPALVNRPAVTESLVGVLDVKWSDVAKDLRRAGSA